MRADGGPPAAPPAPRGQEAPRPVATPQEPAARPPQPGYHVLLIGIDDYAAKPLRGCVNDVDDVQRLLLEEAVIPPASIRRLASPLPGAAHDTAIESAPATLAAIRAALEALASAEVQPHDRVLIYYSGHGTRAEVTVGGRTFHREALVPADVDAEPGAPRLLHDFELNALLARIACRTRMITVILDCCCSAGVTRDVPAAGGATRFLDLGRDAGLSGATVTHDPVPPAGCALPWIEALTRAPRGLAGGLDDCQVVAACLDHEAAQETSGPGGRHNGLLTSALVAALSGSDRSEIREVPWGRIWQRVRGDVLARTDRQHPWISGSYTRAVLGGPRHDGDIGLAVERTGDGDYEIDAGSLAGVTAGTRLAVYGDRPPRFPPLDSPEDLAARHTPVLLEVTRAGRAASRARALGAPFDLPPGARARVVRAGEHERLRCVVVPPHADVLRRLRASPLLEIVDDRDAEVQLVRCPDDRWALADDLHGHGAPPLFTLPAGRLDAAREVLEHYRSYSIPLRMAKRCVDLPGALRLTLLRCPPEGALSPARAQEGSLLEVPAPGGPGYELLAGELFCVHLRSTSDERLRVTLLCAAASGKVQILGEGILDPGAHLVFWAHGELGRPFQACPPRGATEGIDRLVAIGTVDVRHDLRSLAVDRGFASALDRPGGALREAAPARQVGPLDRWTAAMKTLRTRRPPAGPAAPHPRAGVPGRQS